MTKKEKLHLSKDPVLKKLISIFGELEIRQHTDLFDDLISSIISQQLSVKAADTIYKRFVSLFGNKIPTPQQILEMPDVQIRECGISYSKIKYIKGIADAVERGNLVIENLPKMADEQVLAELIKLKGVGQWTAEMFLMFSLGRQDLFSMGDLGLRNAISKLYGVDRDDIKAIEAITFKWSPHRTLACRYLWASLDNIPKK